MERINSVIIRLQNRRQEGRGVVEYAMILAVVSVVAAPALGDLVQPIKDLVAEVGGDLVITPSSSAHRSSS